MRVNTALIFFTMCVRKLRRYVVSFVVLQMVTMATLIVVYSTNNNVYHSNQAPGLLSRTRKLLNLAIVASRPVHTREIRHNNTVTSLVDCESLANHNMTEIRRAQTLLRQERWSDVTTQEFRQELHNCGQFLLNHGYFTQEDTSEFPLAYIILVDTEDMTQIERVVNSVYSPQNFYCLHVDKKTKHYVYETVLLFTSCFNNVFVTSEREEIISGTFSSVKAQLNCMSDLLVTSQSWNYVIKLTSSIFPLTSQAELVTQLRRLNQYNLVPTSRAISATNYRAARYMFVTDAVFEDILYRHTLHAKGGILKFRKTPYRKTIPPLSHPIYYSQSPFYLLTRDFIMYILRDDVARFMTRWFEDVRHPDLYIWGTLSQGPRAPGRGRPGHPKGFNPIIAEKLAPILRLESDETSQPCYGYYDDGSCVFGVGDLTWLLRTKSLFAGKFNVKSDHFVVQCLLNTIHR